MLTKVEVQDLQLNTLSLPLQDVSSGYTVKNIEGLDPVKATIVSSGFAQLDGTQFESARRENRNIIMTIGMEPYSGGATVKSLRANLYAYFMPKTSITLKFYEDGSATPSVVISGTVESCETPLFAKDPEMAISILCFDPSFWGPSEIHLSGTGFFTVDPLTGTETTINYPGTIEAGYRLEITPARAISGFSVLNRRGNTTNQMDVTVPIAINDKIVISSVMREKYITKNGNSILYSIGSSSKLGPFWPGNNYFKVTVAGTPIPYHIFYTPKYGGL